MKNRPVIEQSCFSPLLVTVESPIRQVVYSPPRCKYLCLKKCTCYIINFFMTNAQQSSQQLISRKNNFYNCENDYQIWVLPILQHYFNVCEILLTVGSPIGQAECSPPLFKHLYLKKYKWYVANIITANVKQSWLNTSQKISDRIFHEVCRNGCQSWV